MQLYNTYSNFVPKNTSSKVLHTGRGFLHALIATVDTAGGGTTGSLTLYDNTAASGNILLRVNLHSNANVILELDRVHALKFATGLTAVTTQYVDAYVLSEL